MSEAPELPSDEALAAEHAIGLLSAAERAQAERRMAVDPGFAAHVAAWEARLAPLLEEIDPVAPPVSVWPRIEARLAANDDTAMLRKRISFWRGAAAGSLGLAAASVAVAVMLATRPPTLIAPPEPAPLLNASLKGDAGITPLFVAAYDPDRKALIITSLVPPGSDPVHVHQLWLIPADGKPRSLGMVEPGRSRAMPMPGDMAPMIAEGATLAVSVEAPGGSTNPDGPTGPIAAKGALAKI
ncbi:MAG: anti-sigma factor [Phenylobacterium sp.]|uniref:anti-sigma factor n=1 Tax=Phenylobacterium sp. TaxID=1871053 RepID=UPI002736337F|nr:anti-sigma factor [Phenylobacterium sp.]MDP3174032.1 anti-sigma factor [Phenylobacterium sp.]